MNDAIFREYDIRGKVGEQLFIDQVYDLTLTIAYYLKAQKPSLKIIAVGMDGRTHSPAIKDKVCRALLDTGIDVLFCGLCPSPAFYFATVTQDVDAGLMVTASHNPKEYNGIKIMLGAKPVWGDQIAQIKKLFHENKKLPSASEQGTLRECPINDFYIAWLENHFVHLKNMTIPFIIDCGNGAAGAVIPQLVVRMNWPAVHRLCEDVDGTYPNHEADPTVLKNMMDVREQLIKTDALCGIGFDGDADRMGIMTKNGTLISGDRLLALFAQSVLKKNHGATIIADIKCSENLIHKVEEWGGTLILSPSGHAIIKEAMKKNNALLAGELSCHFFFADRYFGYDDGIYAMLRFLEIVQTSNQSIEELLSLFPRSYGTRELRISYDESAKQEIMDTIKNVFKNRSDVHLICIDGVRVVTPYGWGIIRASNTQPVLSMRFESASADGLAHLKKEFIDLLMPYIDKKLLEHEFDTSE